MDWDDDMKGGVLNGWSLYLEKHGHKGLTQKMLKSRYNKLSPATKRKYARDALKKRGVNKKRRVVKRARKAKGAGVRAGVRAGVSAGKRTKKDGRTGKSSSPWIQFIKAHKGKGYSFSELSEMYHDRY